MNDLSYSFLADSDSGWSDDRTPCVLPVQSEISSRKLKVLVLEDDPAQLQILTQHLHSLNLTPVPAKTLQDAEARLLDTEFQLALLDVHVPDGSGMDLCARIDDDPLLAGLPVVILSSQSQSDIVRQTRSSGGCFFLAKPYDPNVLIAIIERALGASL